MQNLVRMVVCDLYILCNLEIFYLDNDEKFVASMALFNNVSAGGKSHRFDRIGQSWPLPFVQILWKLDIKCEKHSEPVDTI